MSTSSTRMRIEWTYSHALNSISRTWITKQGEYYGKVCHTVKHWRKRGSAQMACVQFDGNKTVSFVPYDDLVFIRTNGMKFKP